MEGKKINMIYVSRVKFHKPLTAEQSADLVLESSRDPHFSYSALGTLAMLHALARLSSPMAAVEVDEKDLKELRTVKLVSYSESEHSSAGTVQVVLY